MRKLIVLAACGALLAAGLVLSVEVRQADSSPADINIHNVQKSFDPMACEVTITWDTDECTTTNLVRWGTSGCQNPVYSYTVYSSGPGRSHSVTFDVTGAAKKINFQVESGNDCDTQTSACFAAVSGPCIR